MMVEINNICEGGTDSKRIAMPCAFSAILALLFLCNHTLIIDVIAFVKKMFQ
jgi:hypothetical protein